MGPADALGGPVAAAGAALVSLPMHNVKMTFKQAYSWFAWRFRASHRAKTAKQGSSTLS